MLKEECAEGCGDYVKDYGNVYLYNMTDRTMNVVVNEANKKLVICPVKFIEEGDEPAISAYDKGEPKKISDDKKKLAKSADNKDKLAKSSDDKEKEEGEAVKEEEESELEEIQNQKEQTYKFFSKYVRRDADPNPSRKPVFGINNKLVYWLANDLLQKKEVTINFKIDELGTMVNQDLQILIFLDKIIMRIDGKADTSLQVKPVNSQKP